MDVERVQRLGSLVAIGVASQVSAEFMTSKSSTHSFWILVGVSLVMMVIQVVFKQLYELGKYIQKENNLVSWLPWVNILVSFFFKSLPQSYVHLFFSIDTNYCRNGDHCMDAVWIRNGPM